MPKELTLKQKILLNDDLNSLLEHIKELLEKPNESPNKSILEEFETLQADALESNALKVILALEHIIHTFCTTFVNFNDLYSKNPQAIYNKMSDIVDKIKTSFESPLNLQPNMDKSVKEELESIYEATSLDKSLVIIGLLSNVIQQQNATEIQKFTFELKEFTKDTETYESHLYQLFLEIFSKDDLDGFELLFKNNEFYNLFQHEEIALLNDCISNDAAKICQFILKEQEHICQKYDAEKIGQLIVNSGSLIGLNSIFSKEAIAAIYKRYDLAQFTKEGRIFWGPEEALQSANPEIIYSKIVATENSIKSTQGHKYSEFAINKKICNINNLTKLAAQHDSPKCLKLLMANTYYDAEALPVEQLIFYAAADNAPHSLEFLLKDLKSNFNTSFDGKSPQIIELAKLAIQNHADKSLEVILASTSFTSACNEMEGTVLSYLLNTAFAQKSNKCYKMLLDRKDYAEMLKKYSITDSQGKSGIRSEDEDSGCERSCPNSPKSANNKTEFDYTGFGVLTSGAPTLQIPTHLETSQEEYEVTLGGEICTLLPTLPEIIY